MSYAFTRSNDELRRVQGELDGSRERYVDLYDLAPVGYCTLGKAGLISQANLTAARLLNQSRGALISQAFSRFILNDDQDIFYLHRKRLLETGEPQSCELRMTRKDGDPFWAHLESTTTQANEDASDIRIVLSDVSVRRHAEIERLTLEAQLQQARKLESIGVLAGGVAHDFNNMLSVILGHVQLALEQVTPDHSLYVDIVEIQKAAKRSAELTQQLLAYASKQVVAPKVMELNSRVDEILVMLRRLIGENITVAWTPAKPLWLVKMDPSQMDQILTNLSVNARDSISDIGTITIETKNCVIDAAYCASHANAKQGEYVRLRMCDSGSGMDSATLEKIFEPFFTTKDATKGVGLGLAMVYGVVTQNHGFISVSSNVGKGTIFEIYLPRYQGPLETTELIRSPVVDLTASRSMETILVVEDETTLLQLTMRMLAKHGFRILGASTPSEAIRLATKPGEKIDLLLTDVKMPQMNGPILAQTIRSHDSNIKFVFMSGYTADVLSTNGILNEGIIFLQKPFTDSELLGKVRAALERVSV
jgi:PAS domain S-box-containing protein